MAASTLVRKPVRAEEPFWAEHAMVDDIQHLSAGSASWPGFSIGRYRAARPSGMNAGNLPAPMFLVVVALRPLPPRDMWRNGHWYRLPKTETGWLSFYDMAEHWVSDITFPVDSFHAYIPYSVFETISAEMKLPKVETLSTR